ncbi:MAG: alkyl sulfatase C-terminal domain-containing protein, partial [Desulfomonilaceae bacterium]
SFVEQVRVGKAKLEGNPEPLMQLMSVLVQFTPDFEIMPGTTGQRP